MSNRSILRPVSLALIVMLVFTGSSLVKGVHLASASPATDQLSETDSIVVQGEVLWITSAIEEHLIVSYVTISVDQVVVGPESLKGVKIILRHLGGEVNGVLLWMSDQPYFAVGENVEVTVRQEGNVYVPVSPKKTLTAPPNVFATAAGYVLMWYKPDTGWQYSTTRPGPDWYGPAKWSTSHFDYWINAANIPPDVSTSSFVTYVTASFQTWQDDPGSSIDFTYQGTGGAAPGTQDGVNSVGWGSIGGSTIAETRFWLSLGDYYSLRYTEADIKLDSSKLWSAQSSGVEGRYDVQNIGTHEAGHTFGLGDLYDSEDSEQTMYGYSSIGETKKRTLEWGDRAGVATLYPSGGYSIHLESRADDGSSFNKGMINSYSLPTNVLMPAGTWSTTYQPESGYSFVRWETIGGLSVSNANSQSTTLTVSGSGTLRAIYRSQQTYTVTFFTDPTSGTITADGVTKLNGATGTYPSGARVHVVANPPSGYSFSYWELSGVSVDSTSSIDTYMTVSNNGWLKAHFSPTSYWAAAVNVLLSIYGSRSDLMSVYPSVTVDWATQKGLIKWAATWGISVDSAEPQLSPYGYLYVLADVYNSRPDLQSAYPEVTSGDLRNLISWAAKWGITTDSAQPNLGWYGHIYLLLDIYNNRLDLQAAYPDVENGDLKGLIDWAARWGVTVDSARLVLEPYGHFYTLLNVYDGRPDLQSAFPGAWGSFTALQGLIDWAGSWGITIDSASSTLKPYAPQLVLLRVYYVRTDLQNAMPAAFSYPMFQSLVNWAAKWGVAVDSAKPTLEPYTSWYKTHMT